MDLLIIIMIIASCFQCLNLAEHKSEKDLKESDKRLFVLLPLTYVFWLVIMNQSMGRK